MTYDEMKQLAQQESHKVKVRVRHKDHEHEIQVACIQWYTLQHANRYPLFAIPNGGWRNAVTAAKLKAEGVRPGVADLFLSLPTASYHGFYIEMKVPHKGKQSDHQILFQHQVETLGYKYEICRSVEEFKTMVDDYIADYKAYKKTLAPVENESLIKKKEKRLAEMIKPFVQEFGTDLCNAFWQYWSEPNKSKTKLKWEMQSTWDTHRRLLTWQRNNEKYNGRK
jgi:hypothetical protein